MDTPYPTERLGWARILAIAISDCVVGFAVFFAAYVGLRGGVEGPVAMSILPSGAWTTVLLAVALTVPPAAVAVMVWVGTRKLHVWAASILYLALALAGGAALGGPHMVVGVVPTLLAAGLYTLPRRRPRIAPVATATTA
jgi:hypothetical protein